MSDNRWIKPLCLLLCALLCLGALAGCRVRIAPGGESANPGEGASGAGTRGDAPGSEESAAMAGGNALPEGEFSEKTEENPNARRKEYDDNAASEILPGAQASIYGPGEGNGAPVADPQAGESAARLREEASLTATRNTPAEEADRSGVSPDADAAESARRYYEALLEDRLDSLFECKKLNVYWETEEDRLTVHKSSAEHRLILESGAYDVSARLMEDNLRVDDGWVVRKNPDIIVKVVDESVLGGAVLSAAGAERLYRALVSRPQWDETAAVREGRVLLISRRLLASVPLQTGARLLLAKTANPELFEDTDVDEALQRLWTEATGSPLTGTYYYCAPEARGGKE